MKTSAYSPDFESSKFQSPGFEQVANIEGINSRVSPAFLFSSDGILFLPGASYLISGTYLALVSMVQLEENN